jgi:hypothetical protein
MHGMNERLYECCLNLLLYVSSIFKKMCSQVENMNCIDRIFLNKSLPRKKALCMSYLENNTKIKNKFDIQSVKRTMKLKLDLVQEQLSGAKFGQIAGGGPSMEQVPILRQFTDQVEIKESVDSDEDISDPIPYMRK